MAKEDFVTAEQLKNRTAENVLCFRNVTKKINRQLLIQVTIFPTINHTRFRIIDVNTTDGHMIFEGFYANLETALEAYNKPY